MNPQAVQIKPVTFLGDSLARVRAFPREARRAVGYQLDRVQRGLEPDDWKPMPAVGPGVREIRVRDRAGAFRVIYLSAMAEAICAECVPEEVAADAAFGVATGGRAAARPEAEVMMKGRTYRSVWDALEDSPEQAANMRLRSELMIALRAQVEAWETTQARAAKRLRITQPRLNDLLRGRIDKFSLDALVALAEHAGLEVRIRVRAAA